MRHESQFVAAAFSMNGWLAQKAKLKWRHARYARLGSMPDMDQRTLQILYRVYKRLSATSTTFSDAFLKWHCLDQLLD